LLTLIDAVNQEEIRIKASKR